MCIFKENFTTFLKRVEIYKKKKKKKIAEKDNYDA